MLKLDHRQNYRICDIIKTEMVCQRPFQKTENQSVLKD